MDNVKHKKILFYYTSKTNSNHINEIADLCKRSGFQVEVTGNRIEVPKNSTVSQAFSTKKYFNIAPIGLKNILKFLYHFFGLLYFYFYFLFYLNYGNIRLLVVSGDRDIGRINSLIKAAGISNIPVVVTSNAIAGPKEESLHFRRNNPGYIIKKNSILSKLLNDVSVYDSKTGERYTFFGKIYTLALRVLGMLPLEPWGRLGGGGGWCCLVDSSATKSSYLRGAKFISEKKYIVTGSLEHDRLYKAATEAPSGSPYIILGIQNWYENGVFTADAATQKHKNILNIGKVARDLGYKVLLALHPAVAKCDYEWMKNEYGFELTQEPIASNLGGASAYVVNGVSSTTRLAILAGIPLFILDDVIEMPSPHECNGNTVFVGNNWESLSKTLLTFLFDDAETYRDNDCDNVIDGQAGKRIIGVFNALLNREIRLRSTYARRLPELNWLGD